MTAKKDSLLHWLMLPTLAAVLCIPLAITGCHTVEGAGEGVSEVGEGISQDARWVESEIEEED